MACFNPGGNGEDKGLGSMSPSLSCPFVDQIEALGHGSCPPMAPFAGPSYLSLMAGVAPVDAFHRPSASDPWCNVAYPINHFADNPAPLERGVEDDSFDADFSG
uniref:Uncharacterized protein n=1 Tax=Arundo donax TaxID=35708 RepID=A0A0A8XWF3_ARUDO